MPENTVWKIEQIEHPGIIEEGRIVLVLQNAEHYKVILIATRNKFNRLVDLSKDGFNIIGEGRCLASEDRKSVDIAWKPFEKDVYIDYD